MLGWIIEKARESQKNIYFCFTDYTKASDCVDHNKLVENSERDGNTILLNCNSSLLTSPLLK